MPRRLEHVRQLRQVQTLKEFHRRITEGDEGISVSYAAARYYHYDRDAPAAYLARVAEVFDVRLEWLATGKGKPTQEEEDFAARAAAEAGRPPDAVTEVLRKAIPFYEDLDNSARLSVLELFGGLTVHNRGPGRWSLEEGARRTSDLLMTPLNTLGVDVQSLKDWQMRGYLSLLTRTIEMLTPLEKLSSARGFGEDVPTFEVGYREGSDEET